MAALTKVAEIMSKDVFSVDIDDTVNKADELMRTEQIRQVPVLENKKFVGMITERSLMEYTLRRIYDFDDEFGEIGHNKISDFQKIMTKHTHVIFPEDSVLKAIQLMAKKKMDFLPVVDWEQNMVGVLTFVDILLYFNNLLSD